MLAKRLQSVIPLIIIVIAAFYAPFNISSWLFAGLSAAMLYFACQEAFALLKPEGTGKLQLIITVLGELLLLTHCVARMAPGKSAVILVNAVPAFIMVAMLAAFAVTFAQKPTRDSVNGILVAIGIFAFIVWPLTYMVKIYYLPTFRNSGDPRMLLFYIILVTKMADVGAYFTGSQMARRKGGNHGLAPFISPKKSWEGLIGGTVFSLAASLIFLKHFNGQLIWANKCVVGWADAVVIGILASPIGLIGDLAESAIKRAADQKDSGHLPGIGGILDILDSLLPMGPLFYAYLLIRHYF